jgi:hypothetical protein
MMLFFSFSLFFLFFPQCINQPKGPHKVSGEHDRGSVNIHVSASIPSEAGWILSVLH